MEAKGVPARILRTWCDVDHGEGDLMTTAKGAYNSFVELLQQFEAPSLWRYAHNRAAVLVQQAHPVITGPQKAALVAQTRGVSVRWIRGISRGYLCHAVDEPP